MTTRTRWTAADHRAVAQARRDAWTTNFVALLILGLVVALFMYARGLIT